MADEKIIDLLGVRQQRQDELFRNIEKELTRERTPSEIVLDQVERIQRDLRMRIERLEVRTRKAGYAIGSGGNKRYEAWFSLVGQSGRWADVWNFVYAQVREESKTVT